jgi:hypothetical protein
MRSLAVPAGKSAPATPWTGRIVTAIPVLFLTFDTVMKFLDLAPVAESFTRLGYPTSSASTIGSLELVCLALYLIPRTARVGLVLLTGYLGGAVASHLRVGDPLLTHILFPTYVAALLWIGLALRDSRLRSFLR